jgi:hypothetical protein
MDLASDVDAKFWGVRNYEGIEFYLESGTVLDPLCPFSLPDLPCPHQGLNQSNYVNWAPRAFLPDDTLGYQKLAELIPASLKINPSLTFVNASYPQPTTVLRKLLSLTNAVPLMIWGLTTMKDYNRFFDLARTSLIRPVIISGSSLIPVPSDFVLMHPRR